MPRDPQELIETFGQVLDGIHIGMCVFDAQNRTLAWNHMFLRIFPEHAGHVHVGEHYRDYLRRFYGQRLPGDEQAQIEHSIEAGIACHRAQTQACAFEHQGQSVEAASLPLGDGGRVSLWRAEKPDIASQAVPAQDSLPVAWLDGVPDGLMVCAPDGRIQWVNESFVRMYGLVDSRSAVSLCFEDVFQAAWMASPGYETTHLLAGLNTLRESLRFVGAPFELPLPGNRFCRVIARTAEGGASFLAHVDITQFKRQQQQLALAERAARESEAQLLRKSALLEATLESMDQGVAMISAEGVVEVFNQRTLDLLGLPRELLDSHPTVQEVIQYQRAHGEFDSLPKPIQEYLASDTQAQPVLRLERKRPDGRVLEVASFPVHGGGLLRTFTDISERKRHEERIQYLARHDSLTGLLNRGMFMEFLAAEVAATRRKEGVGCAVFFIDLDGFKPINDVHGHAMGDKVLEWVAQLLRATVREADQVARLGGDEFAILQRNVEHTDQAVGLMERLQDAFARPLTLEGRSLHIGVSIGIAFCPEHGEEPETLLRYADQAMYAAKAAGRGEGGPCRS